MAISSKHLTHGHVLKLWNAISSLVFVCGIYTVWMRDVLNMHRNIYTYIALHGITICINCLLWGKFTSHPWIPLTKGQRQEVWCFVGLTKTSCWIKSRLTGDLHTIMLLWCKTGVKPVESVKKIFVKIRLNGAPLPLVFIMCLVFGLLYTYLCPQICAHELIAWLHSCLTISQVGGDLKFHEAHLTTFKQLHSKDSVKWTYFNKFRAIDL